MKEDFNIIKSLKSKGFSNIDIEQISNYLDTFEYDLINTRYIGNIFSKNERLAKYFFLRDQLKLNINSLDETFYINEILDQCIDWSEFWRLLVIRKGFCCIRLSGELCNAKRFVFFSGPNLISGSTADISYSIYEDDDF